MIVPVNKEYEDYAVAVQAKIRAAGFFADAELTRRTLNKMVREAQLAQYNFILVVGKEEAEHGTVNVRTRDNAVRGVKSVEDMLVEFHRICSEHTLDVDLDIVR